MPITTDEYQFKRIFKTDRVWWLVETFCKKSSFSSGSRFIADPLTKTLLRNRDYFSGLLFAKFAVLDFFGACPEGARRRFTRRNSAEHRNHAAYQMTKMRFMSWRATLSREVLHDSGVLSHHARIKDRLWTWKTVNAKPPKRADKKGYTIPATILHY